MQGSAEIVIPTKITSGYTEYLEISSFANKISCKFEYMDIPTFELLVSDSMIKLDGEFMKRAKLKKKIMLSIFSKLVFK